MQRRKFITTIGATGVLSALGISSAGANETTGTDAIHGDIENVIFLIGDGMGFDPIQITDHVYDDLAMTDMETAAKTTTYPRDGHVTDSAAAGTAIATGFKAWNGQVSVYGPDGAEMDDLTPITTMLEAAAAVGKSTGLVTTTRMTHATPAVFASHVSNRGQEGRIADHYLEDGPDVLLGGGRREWSEDQLDRAEAEGYELLFDADDLAAAGDDKLLGLFDDSHITYTLDRDESHPWLDEMTETAVQRLEDDDGFFLMVEGGRIDHAEHANDGWTTVAETKEFDDAVDWALEYAEDRDDTLVVVTSDHETSGMAVGAGSYGNVLDEENIANARGSAGAIEDTIETVDCSPRVVVDEYLGIGDRLSDEEVEAFEEGGSVAETLSAHLGIGWAHGSHTGPAQTVLAAGPGVVENEAFDGWFHHVDLAATISAILLFGGVDEVPDGYREQWERNAARRRVSGVRDAYLALQYLGPVEDEVTSSLDINGDGIVDLGDILRIYDEDLEPRTVGSTTRADEMAAKVTSDNGVELPCATADADSDVDAAEQAHEAVMNPSQD